MICNKSFVFFPHNNLSEIEANTFQVTKPSYWINSWAGLKKRAILHHQDHEYFNVWIKLKQLNFVEMPPGEKRLYPYAQNSTNSTTKICLEQFPRRELDFFGIQDQNWICEETSEKSQKKTMTFQNFWASANQNDLTA